VYLGSVAPHVSRSTSSKPSITARARQTARCCGGSGGARGCEVLPRCSCWGHAQNNVLASAAEGNGAPPFLLELLERVAKRRPPARRRHGGEGEGGESTWKRCDPFKSSKLRLSTMNPTVRRTILQQPPLTSPRSQMNPVADTAILPCPSLAELLPEQREWEVTRFFPFTRASGQKVQFPQFVTGVDGRVVPQLQYAISMQALPILPKVDDVAQGIVPLADVLPAPHCTLLDELQIGLDVNESGRVVSCDVRHKHTGQYLLCVWVDRNGMVHHRAQQ